MRCIEFILVIILNQSRYTEKMRMNVIDQNQLVLFRIWFLGERDSFINLQRFTSSALLLDRSSK